MYYNTSANQSSSYKGIILILVGIGLVLGLALIGSDLVKPITSVAEYQKAQVETQRAAQQNEIDLRQYQDRQDARTQAEIAKLQEEVQHLQKLHEEELQRAREETQHLQQIHQQELRQAEGRAALELQLFRVAFHTFLAVMGFSLLSLSIGRYYSGCPC